MKFFIFFTALLLLSCGQNSDKGKDNGLKSNTTNASTDTAKQNIIEKEHSSTHISPLETTLNESLEKVYGKDWHILNDQEAKWMKDAFDYFIVPKRKDNPNYPYITRGDFNGDNKPDIAAVVTDTIIKNFRIAIFLGQDNIKLWEEDVMFDAALSTVPKSTIEGMDGDKTKKIKLNSDGINVEYFEKASFVIYWDNSSFKRIQTSD
jgi:hypothetical protein